MCRHSRAPSGVGVTKLSLAILKHKCTATSPKPRRYPVCYRYLKFWNHLLSTGDPGGAVQQSTNALLARHRHQFKYKHVSYHTPTHLTCSSRTIRFFSSSITRQARESRKKKWGPKCGAAWRLELRAATWQSTRFSRCRRDEEEGTGDTHCNDIEPVAAPNEKKKT
jgi:hypothetical protein